MKKFLCFSLAVFLFSFSKESTAQVSLSIDSLQPGKRILISFEALIADPIIDGSTDVKNQATITGSNFTTVISDDPDTAPFMDSTVTPVNPPFLPISLMRFKVQKAGERQVLIEWAIAQQIDNDRFEVQRSLDGFEFSSIGYVAGSAQSQELAYHFTDKFAQPGYNYYRLKQVDNDGLYSLSEVRAVYFDSQTGLSIFPNPFKGSFNIQVADDFDGELEVRLNDVLSRTCFYHESYSFFGGETVNINPKPLAAGIYMLSIRQGNDLQLIKLVKE